MGNITTRQDTTTLSPRSAGILSDSPIEEISNDSKLPPYHHGRVLKLDRGTEEGPNLRTTYLPPPPEFETSASFI